MKAWVILLCSFLILGCSTLETFTTEEVDYLKSLAVSQLDEQIYDTETNLERMRQQLLDLTTNNSNQDGGSGDSILAQSKTF
jgi:hypothetical protein